VVAHIFPEFVRPIMLGSLRILGVSTISFKKKTLLSNTRSERLQKAKERKLKGERKTGLLIAGESTRERESERPRERYLKAGG